MAPTKYPIWRFFAFAIGFVQALGVISGILRLPAAVPSISELFPSPEKRLIAFSLLLLFIGIVTMIRRPALGFLIFGAGFLVGVASLVVHQPWKESLAMPAALLLVPGLGYTWIGWKQLAKDRETSG